MTNDEYFRLVSAIYQDFLPPGQPVPALTSDTRLFGGDSPLDSTALVSLLVEVEQQVNEACHTEIVLADDRAMSQSRSPFRTLGTLAGYVQLLVSERDQD